MLSPFDFAPYSLRSGTSQAKLREASRSSNNRVLLAVNEILRRCAPQNDMNEEVVMTSEANHPAHYLANSDQFGYCYKGPP